MKTKQEIVENWLPRYTHRNLEDFGEYILLTKAGIPGIDVLRSATRIAADVLGVADIGSIATGKIADILVLEKSPIDNISILTNKQNITCVFQG